MNFLNSGLSSSTSNKQIDFGADQDHDPDPGILYGIFIAAGYGQL